MFNKALGIN